MNKEKSIMDGYKGEARLPNESYKNYAERRNVWKIILRKHLAGKLVWDSKEWGTMRYDNKKALEAMYE
ncbi:hypothetical protein KAR91_39455 [Candidatus Pacearchaeota archaeon]|nr:hypothetical protein [Candidatus Pacearchaeota archaeon]